MAHRSSKTSLLDSIITNLLNYKEDHDFFDVSSFQDMKSISSVPMRYRIIADAFVFGLSLEETNSALIKNGCAQLYARSPYEAALIYAFSNNLSYEEWKSLISDSEKILSQISADPHLSKGSVSLADIRSYIDSNSSEYADGTYITEHRTAKLGSSLSMTKDRKDFIKFLLRNAAQYSFVRESSRYYFCKYLMYYLDTRKSDYLRALETGRDIGRAFRNLAVFRVQTALDRRKSWPDI